MFWRIFAPVWLSWQTRSPILTELTPNVDAEFHQLVEPSSKARFQAFFNSPSDSVSLSLYSHRAFPFLATLLSPSRFLFISTHYHHAITANRLFMQIRQYRHHTCRQSTGSRQTNECSDEYLPTTLSPGLKIQFPILQRY